MPQETKVGCAIGAGPEPEKATVPRENPVPKAVEEEKTMLVVGQKAPDFEAKAYLNGKFVSVKLSEYLGQWVLLCFYPGDFTFV